MRYLDAALAITWLGDAFGFETHLVAEEADGCIAHAQLTLGDNMIMLGSVRDGEFDAVQKTPKDLGGKVTMSIYVVVADVDEHFTRARAAGAEITLEPADQDYGGRLYSCFDLEGHLWNFGSYDPWLA
ncbi:MAG: putative glyoxalase superfamily protein PhnB [Gammaproteobacteria bacterium]|jgi:uncharacterized glyoxalase superfamily protein PhnB